ncbi:hypothetical protein [Thauera aminoaromatica]|uniref:Uncharacterized protein n=1 Tax=Thauera aminoaromatica S2 TaxID=1234381 RepID=N6Z006_THASP|nr:hypothetical protein [Thauera aminoaromatica]ENO87932.1 hypothetical protein C665_03537 [Thauera aminoaromatica S2]
MTLGTPPRFDTDNPRHQRVLALLLQRPAKREEVDRAAGASNGPELVAELRRRGLELPCERVEAIDRDGRPCRPGVYHATPADRRKIAAWLRSRSSGRIAPELAGWLALGAVSVLLLMGA